MAENPNKTQGVFTIIFLIIFLSPGCLPRDLEKLNAISWMQGVWHEKERTKLAEAWLMEGEKLYGAGMEIRDFDTIIFEKMEIREMDFGLVMTIYVYVNEEPVELRSTLVSDSMVVFERPGNEFPSKITYYKIGENQLDIRAVGNLQLLELHFQREPWPRDSLNLGHSESPYPMNT